MSLNEEELSKRVPCADRRERRQEVTPQTNDRASEGHGSSTGGKEKDLVKSAWMMGKVQNPVGKNGKTPSSDPVTKDFIIRNVVVSLSGCWEWSMHRDRRGYGRVCKKRYGVSLSHRLSWILFHGDIPTDNGVLHRCNNPPCCNPEHLYLGGQSVNIKDAHTDGLILLANSKKMHCPKCGGLYDQDRDKGRFCRPCHNKATHDWYFKRKAARQAIAAAMKKAPPGEG